MKLKVITLLFLICTLLCGCPEKYPNGHKYITIINNSDIEIAFSAEIDWKYQDFCPSYHSKNGMYYCLQPINKNSSFKHYAYDNHKEQPWELYLDK